MQKGDYGRERALVNQIKADAQYLENGPLGPIQRVRLAKQIEQAKLDLREVRKRIKEGKRK